MTIRFESELLAPARSLAESRWVREGETWAILHEQDIFGRIPDLVLARLDVEALLMRAEHTQLEPLTTVQTRIIRFLRPDRRATVSLIARHAGLSIERARRALSSLADRGLADRNRAGTFALSRRLPSIVSRVISIELKLHDWKSALIQARRHQICASEAYVAFDAKYKRRFLKARPQYAQMGVGQIAVNPPDGARLIFKAKTGTRFDRQSLAFFSEKLLFALLGGAPTQLPQARLPGASARIVDPEQPKILGHAATAVERLLSSVEPMTSDPTLHQVH